MLRSWCRVVVWILFLGVAASSWPQEPKPQTEKKITPAEAKELFRSVDDILKFVSEHTGLPIKHEVKRRLVTRDEVVAYLEKHMAEDEDSQRLQRSEVVLKKFGLLPRNFDLKPFLIALLREQVAGYYDPKTQTVNLLDWIDPEQQKPVLAHELTHALQDQNFGLEKWMKAGIKDDLLKSDKNPTPQALAEDEMLEARQAVVEGQATVVLFDYMLAPTGQSFATSPQLVEAMKAGMLVGTADAVQFQNAPVAMKEVLTFPYRYGLDLVGQVFLKQGKESAYAGLIRKPPANSRQVMEPATYLANEALPPMPVPDFAHIFGNYERFDVGSFGEFDTALLVDQFAGPDRSRQMYPTWRGGYYYAVKPKNDEQAPLGLAYVSRWSNAEHAAEFAAVYAQSLTQRYQRAREAVADGASVLDLKTLETLSGTHTWLTEEGPVVIAVGGDLVLVTESVDPQASEELQHALLRVSAATTK